MNIPKSDKTIVTKVYFIKLPVYSINHLKIHKPITHRFLIPNSQESMIKGLQMQTVASKLNKTVMDFEKEADRQIIQQRVQEYDRDWVIEQQNNLERTQKLQEMVKNNIALTSRYKKMSQLEENLADKKLVQRYQQVRFLIMAT